MGIFYLQCAAGRFEEGAAQAEQAVRIDPLSAWARAMLALTYVPVDVDRCLEAAAGNLADRP